MIPIECKIDKLGILYIDDLPVKERIEYCSIPFCNKALFYKINSTNEYIIKHHLDHLNKRNILKMLLMFYNIGGNNLNNIDFPIGYYKENKKIQGLIIPNYPYAPSIRDVVENDNISKYYYHCDNDKDNVLYLLSEIFKILKDLYDYGIIYTDINPGNFLIYNNEVKIIDFEPKYLFKREKDKDNFYLKMLLFNYKSLINYICRRRGLTFYGMNQIDNGDFSGIKKYVKEKK